MRQKQPEAPKDIRPSMTTYYRPDSQLQRPESFEPKPKKSIGKRVLTYLGLALIVLLVPLLIIGYMDFRNFSTAAEKLFGTSSLVHLLSGSTLKSSPDGTTHILIAGYSADDPGHGGAALTDTIMVLSINKHTGKGYMLSIPRDLYVQIPGNGSAKINEVYQDGERDGFSENGFQAGGMGLLTKTIEEVTGVDIHYNFLVNYGAVRDITNALDGVVVTIKSPDPQGIYDPGFKPEEGGALKLPNGASEINGQTALKITRARGLSGSSYGYPQADFNRTQYQQALMVGILQDLSWKLVLNPHQNKQIFDAIANNVQTSVQIDEALPLFRLLNKVELTSLSTHTLRTLNGKNYVTSYQTPYGQSALVPLAGRYDYSDIRMTVASINSSISK